MKISKTQEQEILAQMAKVHAEKAAQFLAARVYMSQDSSKKWDVWTAEEAEEFHLFDVPPTGNYTTWPSEGYEKILEDVEGNLCVYAWRVDPYSYEKQYHLLPCPA